MQLQITILLIGATLISGETCQENYVRVGCFKDNVVPERALKTQLLNRMDPYSKKGDGELIDLTNYGPSLKDLICNCSQLAKAGGFDYFGIQFYGECWAGNATDFSRHGISKGGCVDESLKDGSCDSKSECAGRCGENFVYRIRKPVNGGWGAWGEYGACAGACGGKGVQTRYRGCINPRPVDGGSQCAGPSFSTRQCDTDPCPGKWDNWSSWSQCIQTRQRQCTVGGKPAHWSKCGKHPTEKRTCKNCQGNWGNWGDWTDCMKPNVPCGTGTKTRRRVCLPFPGFNCPGESEEKMSCQHQCQKTWTSWSSWSGCSKTCGGGIRTRNRKCVAVGTSIVVPGCSGLSLEREDCNTQACPVWVWGSWSSCSVTCGSGSQRRVQICVLPGSTSQTSGCSGHPRAETKICTLRGCPVWAPWSPWSPCPKCKLPGAPIPKTTRLRRCVYQGTNTATVGCVGSHSEIKNCITLDCGPAPCLYACQPTDFEGPVCVKNKAGKKWTVANECAFKRLRKCSMPDITMTHGKCLFLPTGPIGPSGPGIPVGPQQ